ncbi:hypothetical protein EXS56_02015 [Candidatus Kaiserbacteria bacterium]|nr:hypothetical protein [Candidatus Kaiserbacteria bacterium]
MRVPTLLFRALASPLILWFPALAHAGDVGAGTSANTGASFTQAIGLFNVFVGLMLTMAILTYGLGFFLWLCRLGTWPTYRTEAIKIMEWSVVVLFVLVVLLAIVQFFQYHPREAAWTVSVIVGIIIIWIIVYLAAHSGGGKKKKEASGGAAH